MATPTEKEKQKAQQKPSPQFPEDATTHTMAPPPLALQADQGSPIQAFGGFFDTLQSGWDWLMGNEKTEAKKDAPATEQKAPEKQPAEQQQVQAPVEAAKEVSSQGGVFEITDSKALIRTEGDLTPEDPQRVIPKGEKVTIWQTVEKDGKKYVNVVQHLPDGMMGPPMPWGWTSYGNLTPANGKEEEKAAEGGETAEGGQTTEGGATAHNFKTKHAHHGGADWSGSNLTNLMLKKAGFDPPSLWWDNFTDINLLGRGATGIHKEFAGKLKDAEAKIVAAVGADPLYQKWLTENPDAKGDDAKKVGKYLGINGYATSRTTGEESSYASMHLFGLAIDFNYTQNPWISDDGGKQTWSKDGSKPTSKTAKLQDFLNRAGSLTGETLTFNHVNADNFKYDMGSTYDNFSKLDKGAEKYFSFLDTANEAEMMALVGKSADPVFAGKSADDVRKIIQQDLDTMASEWSRGSKAGKESVKANGIMDLDRRVVMAMGEVGLDWGGKYGDMMHFDMRNVGIGKKVQASKYDKEVKELKAKYKAQEEEEAKKKAEEAKRKKEEAKAAKK